MRDSFKYMFLLDGKKLSLVGFSEKYIKNGLYKTENQFPIPGTKHSSKNTSLLLLTRKLKKIVSLAAKCFSVEIGSL